MRTMPWTRVLRYVIFLTVFLVVSPGNAQQLPAAKFFNDKAITFIVGSRPGGSYDAVGRLLSKFIAKHTGARVIVKNVEGGGGIQGGNAIYTSKPDGLTLGLLNAGMMQEQTLGGKGVRFDLNKYTWYGRTLTSADCTGVSAKSNFRSVEDLLAAKSFKEGNAGAGSVAFLKSVLLKKALGWNSKMVSGYGNTSEMLLALIRGEIDSVATTWDTIGGFVKSGEVIPVSTTSGIPEFPKVRILSTIPAVQERLSPMGKEFLNLDEKIGIGGLGRMVAGTPAIPADRAKYLEEVIQKKVLTDPDFVKAAKQGNYTISPLSGSELLKAISVCIATIEKYRSVIAEGLKEAQL